MREKFTANYIDEIQRAYSTRYDGKVILKFPRLFILAVQ
jgi:trans-aconitate methyltransferase